MHEAMIWILKRNSSDEDLMYRSRTGLGLTKGTAV
jgi:hypothetical protein